MNAKSNLASMVALMDELERLRLLKEAVIEYVDYEGKCLFVEDENARCGCEYCNMINALDATQ